MKERIFMHKRAGIAVLLLLELLAMALVADGFLTATDTSFVTRRKHPSSTQRHNWLGDLWEEVIEFSTYGPAERKMLKAKREAAAAQAADVSATSSFQKAREKVTSGGGNMDNDESSSLSLQAFQSAVAAAESTKENDDNDLDFDGYELRDLLVSKWGVPLDIDFQRGYSTDEPSVYCTVLPFAFGSLKCRHVTELDYLMHLQAVVEILHEYGNLEEFRAFVESTKRAPKPGVESVPFRLELSPQQLQKVMGAAR